MNEAQKWALVAMTNRVERFNRLHAQNFAPMNGVLTWRLLDWEGAVVVEGSNLNEEKKWYETHIHIIVEIGIRGGLRIRTCEGMARNRIL